MCPECGSDHITFEEYDFGICSQTGYHDAGERFRCGTCGATGDVADACPPHEVELWVLPGGKLWRVTRLHDVASVTTKKR